MAFHSKANEMKRILDKHGIQKLYHFTAIDNLAVIAECGGLWSKEKLERAGLFDKIITGGNDLSISLDRSLGNWDKISLHFCPRTPMAYRIQQNFWNRDPQTAHICYFIINSSIALWDGVIFTDTNATRTIDGQKRGQGLEGMKLIDFDTIKSHLYKKWVEPKQRWHRNVQAECLVPNEIPLKYVQSISFISKASLKEGERIWKNIDHPSFNVNESLFYSGFPIVYDFLLTSKEVTGENVKSQKFEDSRVFFKKQDLQVTLLVNLYTTSGTQAKVVWCDSNSNQISEVKTEFEKESGYWHWPSLEIINLKEGNYSVEYYLKDIRWFKAHFQIRR